MLKRFVLPFVLSLTIVCFAQDSSNHQPPANVDWSMFGFSASGGRFNPSETLINTQNANSLVLAFQFVTSANVLSPPVVANGIAYFGSGSTVYAVDATTGVQVWSKTLPAALENYSSLAAVNGIVYVNAGRFMVALNASTGSILWHFGMGTSGIVHSTVANGVIYFGSADDNVYAVNAATGAPIWKFKTGNTVNGLPVVSNGIVYVGSTDRYLYAINASTGAMVWKYGLQDPATGAAVVANGVVYLGSNSLFAVNANTGTLIWKIVNHSGNGPAFANGVLYLCNADGTFVAVNAADGSNKWLVPQGCFAAANAPPAIANGVIYVGGVFSDITAYNATNGSQLWTYQMGSRTGNSATAPSVVNGMVYVGAELPQSLYAFKLP